MMFGGRNIVIPPVVKNLLIINGLFFLGTYAFESAFHIDLIEYLGLYYWTSDHFQPYQIVTHMFMHAGFQHILLNMFTLWMFGSVLEQAWGPKRFLIYYFVTGLGSALLHNTVKYIDIQMAVSSMSPEIASVYLSDGVDAAYRLLGRDSGTDFNALIKIAQTVSIPSVGASGAVYGLLLAYGMLFPNTLIYLYFAIPVKAKYFVMGLIALELYLGFSNNPGDNVAHFAHLGGVLFGYLLLKYWKQNRNHFY